MLRTRIVILVLSLAPLGAWGQASTLAPGQWHISVQTQAAGMPLPMAPMQVNQCLTEKDAQDPSKMLGGVSSPEAADCVYSDRAYVGDHFHFAMQCGGALALRARGDISFTATSLSGTIDATANLNGQSIELTNTVTAQRVGACHGAG